MLAVVPQTSSTWKSLVCGNLVFGYSFLLFDSGNLIMNDLGKINKCSKSCCFYLEYSFAGFMTGVIQFDKRYGSSPF